MANESIPLREIAELGYQYNGWQVVSVRATTSSIDPNTTTVQLSENGRILATQVNPGSQISLNPTEVLLIDNNTSSIALTVTGATHIEVISIELRNVNGANIDLNWGYAQYVDLKVNIDAQANSAIDFNDYANMQIFQGRILERVNVIAALPANTPVGTVANVSLMSDNNTNLGTAAFNSVQLQQLPIWTDYDRFVLGENVNNLMLYMDNNVHVDRVILKVK